MDYQLKSIGKHCHATGEPLTPGSRCHSALVERRGELVRLDYLATAWPGTPDGAIADWLCEVPSSTEVAHTPLDTESLFELFEELLDEASPGRESLVYVLALLLVQKRRLRIEDTGQPAESETLLVSGSQGEGPFEIRDQNLSDTEIERLQQELNGLLLPE